MGELVGTILLGAGGIVAQRIQERLSSHPLFRLKVVAGSPNTVGGFNEVIHNPVYATSVGLLLYGHKQMQEDHMNYIHRDKNILNRLSRWFGGNL